MKTVHIPYFSKLASWDDVKVTDDFAYPWRTDQAPRTSFQAYHDNRLLHFRYVAYGPHPLVYVNKNHKLEVIHSERVEIFFKRDDTLNPYYCFEIDPYARVLDYEAVHYREFNRAWQWPGQLNIEAIISDKHYTVTGAFDLGILKKLDLIHKNQLEVGLYRGQCTSLVEDKEEIRWISWVDPKTPTPDFHVPSSFGKFVLENFNSPTHPQSK